MNRLWLLLLLIIFYSCEKGSLFSTKSHHQAYAERLEDAGLRETVMGQSWFMAAEGALAQPLEVALPHREIGFFAADKPRALGFQFEAIRGQQITISLQKEIDTTAIVFVDVWRLVNDRRELIASVEPADTTFEFTIKRDGRFVVRVQPELLTTGNYTLTITHGPSLAYPAADETIRIWSLFGAARDAGRRVHEGVDVFGARHTPLVAVADGVITRVGETPRGGKIIWLRPTGMDISVYYAHLQDQFVEVGQMVNRGDTIGTMGNSGNAESTRPHLHFGIYAQGGAIDPLHFIDPRVSQPREVSVAPERLQQPLRLTSDVKITINAEEHTLPANTVVIPVAATARNYYRIELPDGALAHVPITAALPAETAIASPRLQQEASLKAAPVANAPRKKTIPSAATVRVHGYYEEYAYVRVEDEEGWLLLNAIR